MIIEQFLLLLLVDPGCRSLRQDFCTQTPSGELQVNIGPWENCEYFFPLFLETMDVSWPYAAVRECNEKALDVPKNTLDAQVKKCRQKCGFTHRASSKSFVYFTAVAADGERSSPFRAQEPPTPTSSDSSRALDLEHNRASRRRPGNFQPQKTALRRMPSNQYLREHFNNGWVGVLRTRGEKA